VHVGRRGRKRTFDAEEPLGDDTGIALSVLKINNKAKHNA